MKITVLRLGHRKERDKRITTHCALVARAFGAAKIILSGERDDAVIKSVRGLVKTWGGEFEVEYRADWRKAIKNFRGFTAHLTMYGEKLPAAARRIRREAGGRNLLVIIGAGKVPSEVYKMVDANVAVGSQPHSEVAALAAFLLKILGEKPLWAARGKAKLKIIPQKKSKRVATVNL